MLRELNKELVQAIDRVAEALVDQNFHFEIRTIKATIGKYFSDPPKTLADKNKFV